MKQLPLHLLLTIPIVVQLFAVVSVVGWLAIQSQERSIRHLATQLNQQVVIFTDLHLNAYFTTLKMVQFQPLSGAIATDLNHLLYRIGNSTDRTVLLINRSGKLIASSLDPLAVAIPDDPTRDQATRSRVDYSGKTIAATVSNPATWPRQLAWQSAMLWQQTASQQLELSLQGEQQFVQVVPWQNRFGLDWLIVVVVPKSHFTVSLPYSTHTAILFCLIAFVAAAYTTSLTARLVVVPILRLSQAADAIANGQLDQTVKSSGIRELEQLAASFNRMVRQLNASFASLAAANETLEQRIAERTAVLLNREQQVLQHNQILVMLSTHPALSQGDFSAACCAITEAASQILEVERVGIWLFQNDKTDLRCIDLFEQSQQQHSQGLEISMRHYPQYFRAWEQQWAIAAHDVFTDANLYELVDSYLRPSNITSVLHSGIRLGGETIGVICVEHVSMFRHWSPEEQSFVASLAGLVALAIEASDRVQAKETIQHSLREKEVLLKEVHHRVKNNLHIISNLLDLQSDRIQDQHLLGLFSDAQTRIQAMALIHEQLYQSDKLGQINFASYLRRLLENIFFSTHSPNYAIQPLILAEPVLLNLETAVPCGLLINELVTNALKHAFPGKQGSITIRLYQSEDTVHVVVQDDGIGLPDDFDWHQSSSLGLKLVHILAKQLRAELAIDGRQGVRVELKFSQLKYKSRL